MTHNGPRLLLTGEHDCPYLEGRRARNLVVEPGAVRNSRHHTEFSRIGFRRSGEFLYRPHCAGCNACTPARVPVAEFQWRRRHRRCWRANADLRGQEGPVEFSEEAFELYQRYQQERHAGGPMLAIDETDYLSFMEADWADNRMVEFFLEGRRVAVMVMDGLGDGLSAVYSFYEPQLSRRALGRFTVLWLIEQARQRHLPYVYLGYWIPGCRKMAYKTDFLPIELRLGNRWVPHSEPPDPG